MVQPINPDKLAMLTEVRRLFPGNDGPAQRLRVREVLERGYSLSTFEASRYLDVYWCPARVMELRKAGLNIVTHWTVVETESGETHRVGNYLLVREVRNAA